MHAHEMHARKSGSREMHACKMHTNEIHACKRHAYKRNAPIIAHVPIRLACP